MTGWNPVHGFDTGPSPPRFSPQPGQAVPVTYVQGVPVQYFQGVPVYVGQPQPQPVFVQQQLQPQHIYIHTPSPPAARTKRYTSDGYEEWDVDTCLVHVITTKTAPWELTGPLQYKKVKIPVHVSIKDVMQNMGCDNKDAKKNVLTEVVEKGNGGWTTGLKFSGDQEDKIKKPIKDYGWDKTRTGNAGDKPIVWIYGTKD